MPRDYSGRGRGGGGRSRNSRPSGGSRRNTRRTPAANRRKSPARKGGRAALPGWVWLFCGLSLGLLVAGGIYIATRPVRRHMSTVLQTLPARPGPTHAAKPAPAASTAPSKPQFDFYRMLPNYEVVIPKEKDRTPAQKAHPQVAKGGTYVIQVASFKDRKSADAEKAKLALLGIEAQIQQATTSGGQVWYRVRVGPSQDTKRLDRVLSLLKQHHVDSLVMRARTNG